MTNLARLFSEVVVDIIVVNSVRQVSIMSAHWSTDKELSSPSLPAAVRSNVGTTPQRWVVVIEDKSGDTTMTAGRLRCRGGGGGIMDTSSSFP